MITNPSPSPEHPIKRAVESPGQLPELDEHAGCAPDAHHSVSSATSMALSATLHCLSGCAIGEITGLMIGTAAGLSNGVTVAISIALAFAFGFLLSSMPLLRAGLSAGAALSVVATADTLSIATMEAVDNVVMAVIPGAMNAGLVNAVFWVGMLISLTVALFAAWPVNRYLIERGRGHALTHEYHHAGAHPAGASRYLPDIATSTLLAVLLAFILGGLIVSIADDLDTDTSGTPTAANIAAVLRHSTHDGPRNEQ